MATKRSPFAGGSHLTLETFSAKDFNAKDFVESLTENALASNRRGVFDPKPLIRTFESALAQIDELAHGLDEKEVKLAADIRRATAEHDETVEIAVAALTAADSGIENLIEQLDEDLTVADPADSSISTTVVETMAELERQRDLANYTAFLVKCWFELAEEGTLTLLDALRRNGSAGSKARCGKVCRHLLRISESIDPESWRRDAPKNDIPNWKGHNTKEKIEACSEALEQDLLRQFDNSYREQDFEGMKECATILQELNGGANVIALFVNQHQFFIDRSQLNTDEVTTDREFWDRLADPDADGADIEPSLRALVDQVKVVLEEESSIIKRAFPNHEVVLTRFLQRVFQQSIQQRLEIVLEKAASISPLAFLRSLYTSRSYILTLIEDLKEHGLTEHPESCTPETELFLEQQTDELFVPYLVGTSYIDSERKSLESLFNSLLFKFTLYHSKRPKVPAGFMASLAQQGTQLLSAAKDAYIERLDSSELTPTQKAMMVRVAGVSATANKNEIEVTEEDGLLSVPNAQRMLKWLMEGVKRVLELGGSNNTLKFAAILLDLLLSTMAQVYVETAMDATDYQVKLLSTATKVEPDLEYLHSLRPASMIMNLVQRLATEVFFRLAKDNVVTRQAMERKTHDAITTFEIKFNRILDQTYDIVGSWVTRLLSGQKRADFRPKDSELDGSQGIPSYLEQLQTPTCAAICDFIGKTFALGEEVFDEHDYEVFCTEIALAVRDLIEEHFKKFQVNATGALMVNKDMSQYLSTLRSRPLRKGAAKSMETLTFIGSLFVIGPDGLKERSRDIERGLEKEDVRAYITKREDSGSVGIQSVLAGL